MEHQASAWCAGAAAFPEHQAEAWSSIITGDFSFSASGGGFGRMAGRN